MTIVTSIFSALGNNSSLYPIIFKDSIDNASRTGMAFKEGSKNGKEYGLYDARERFIDENVTSVVWIGGIPALKLLYDKFVTNKIYKFSNYESLGSTFDKKGTRVMADTNVKLLDGGLQTLEKNIAEIKEILKTKSSPVLEKMVEDAEKIIADKASKAKFKRVYAGKMAASSIIPLVTIGFILPKLIQALTKNIYKDNTIMQEEQAKKMALKNSKHTSKVFASFKGQNENDKDISFKGKPVGNLLIDLFNNNVSNQALLDGGIFVGRVATGVNLADKIEKGIKEIGVIFFIYFGGTIVGKMIEKLAQGMGMPIALDSKILENKNFQQQIKDIAKISDPAEKEKALAEFLKFSGDNEESVLKFIDGQIKSNKGIVEEVEKGVKTHTFSNPTLKIAQKLGVVDLIDGVKNPIQYIDTDKVKSLHTSLTEYVKKALPENASIKDVEKFLHKSVLAKRFGVVANLAICTIATAYILPKLQYRFREKFTNSSNLPALETYDQQIKAERFAGRVA